MTTTTNPLIVDSTPPSSGLVFINHGQKNIAYVSSSVCTVSIQGFKDNESGIAHFEIGLGSNKDANDIEAGLVHISDHFNLQLSDSLHDGHQYYVTVKVCNFLCILTVYLCDFKEHFVVLKHLSKLFRDD